MIVTAPDGEAVIFVIFRFGKYGFTKRNLFTSYLDRMLKLSTAIVLQFIFGLNGRIITLWTLLIP